MPESNSNTSGAAAVLRDIELGDSPVPLADVPGHPAVPKRGGKRPHVSVIYRWIGRGIDGHKLEAAKLAGTSCTTASALVRFFAATAGVKVTPSTRTPGRRERDVDR